MELSEVTATTPVERECKERNGDVNKNCENKDKPPHNGNGAVIASTETIVSNAVAIDVIGANGSVTSHLDKIAPPPQEKKKKGGNAVVRYFMKNTMGLTTNQLAILIIFPFVEFFAATIISIQGPFYPKVARSKGATPFESGLVFGSFELIVFIMAPVYGAKMGTWNPNRMFNYGIFTTSLSCIIFGFLHHIEGRYPFILMSLIVRSIEAFGDAAFVVASFSIIAAEFPESVATTFALMETFYGLGMIAGPTVGGGLYELGGFTLPFVVMGGLLLISAVATYIYLTRNFVPSQEKTVTNSSFGMFKMLKIPVIALTAYGTFAAATGIGFLNNNLEHHMEPFHLSEWQVGWIFMLNGGVYALSAPFWGKLCDVTSEPKIYSMVGSLLTVLGFLIAGPFPAFTYWEPTIPLVCIGLVIFGLGLGSTLVSAFIQFLLDALANGHPDNVTTHGLVSGLWTSMTALGFFVGATFGGLLDSLVGFRWGTLFLITEHLLVVALLLYYFYCTKKTPASLSSPGKKEDNMNDIVITYAIKMNTPKPRKMKSKQEQKNVPAVAPAASAQAPAPPSSNGTSTTGSATAENGNKEVCSANTNTHNEEDTRKGKDNPNFVEET